MNSFNKILIANRGEIAVRVMKSARKLGIRSVAVYSEVDKDALHVQMADEAYCIGQQELSETYLNIDKIIEVAKKSNCGAIHPGYGFLAENQLFVKACDKAGITFIGPHADAIRLMGNKIESREFVKKLGVPMTQGITGSPEELLKNAKSIQLPILVKAAAGGGGKGMRIVNDYEELAGVLESTTREAKNYFGDESVFIEKYVEEPRHIEFQVLGDSFGNVIHLFERECTIQRRYQKIIEESPSPTLTPEVRKKMGDSAVAIAKAVNYTSAGTIEFLVDKHLNYFFLEMNTRIQVEHPVTEMVTDTDLIEEQIRIAQGLPLKYNQEDIKQKGHAIECRIYAEDPSNKFMPSPGMMTLYHEPSGQNIRVDSGLEKATMIHSFFDPMICKLVIWASDRKTAIEDSLLALNDFIVHGIQTNTAFLTGILKHQAFAENKITTKFCEEHTDEIIESIATAKNKNNLMNPVLAYGMHSLSKNEYKEPQNIWEQIGHWRNIIELPFVVDGEMLKMQIIKNNNPNFEILFNGEPQSLSLNKIDANKIEFTLGKNLLNAYISTDDKGQGWVNFNGQIYMIQRTDLLNEKVEFLSGDSTASEKNLFAPMPGKVIKVNVQPGDKVKRGTVMLVVEAMKMENNIVAEQEAIVEKIAVKEGDMVDTDVQLIHLEIIDN